MRIFWAFPLFVYRCVHECRIAYLHMIASYRRPTWEVLCVFWVTGAATFFAWPSLSSFGLGLQIVICCLLGIALFRYNLSKVRLFVYCGLTFLCGYILAHTQTMVIAQNGPDSPVRGFVDIEGEVTQLDMRDDRVRIFVQPHKLEDVDYPYSDWQFRLYGYPKQTNARVGDIVSLRARVQQPSLPLAPNGYDFAKASWFKNIHADGFLISQVTIEQRGSADEFMANFRQDISEAIARSLDSPTVAIARALLIGQRDPLLPEIKNALRVTGLMHLLAISGLHMGMVCGFVFFFTRSLLARIGSMALFYPVKSYAALCAIFVGGAT
ncbi:MAG: ComEC/Rec2 family competence protein [Pseudomonadota bacterium]